MQIPSTSSSEGKGGSELNSDTSLPVKINAYVRDNKILVSLLFCVVLIIALLGYIIGRLNNDSVSSQIDNPKHEIKFISTDGEKSTRAVREIANAKGGFDWDAMEKLPENVYYEQKMKTGEMPQCYGYIPMQGTQDNFLEVQNKSDHDALVKVMNIETNQFARYIYIQKGDSFRITNVPLGKYYLKIGHGSSFVANETDGVCDGFFDSLKGFYSGYFKETQIFEFYPKTKDEQIEHYYILSKQWGPFASEYSKKVIEQADF